MAPPPPMNPMIFSTELLFTIIAVIFCFLIYFKTREIYKLTKYEGIKYFRGAFLFFGLSYVLRFIFSLIRFTGIAFDFFIPREMFALLFILPLGYFSTIGILYLIFGSVWKRFKSKKLLVIGHVIAVLLSVISFLTRSHIILLYLQTALLVIAATLSFFVHKKDALKKEKKITGMKMLYLLISALWLINLWIIDEKRPFPLEVEIFFQIISLIVFIIIYHKVSKWLK
jgi:hypothetical protein